MKTIIEPKVKVGIYTVQTVELNEVLCSGQSCWGTYDTKKDTILLDKSLSPQRKEEVWIHELLHAISIDRGIRLKEKMIDRLAPAIYCFLKDNGYLK